MLHTPCTSVRNSSSSRRQPSRVVMEKLTTFHVLLLSAAFSFAVCELWGNPDGQTPQSLELPLGPSGPGNVVLSGPSTVVVGQDYKFACQTECDPPCSFTWILNGKIVANSTNEFFLQPANYSDNGVLSCQALNEVTQSQKTVYKVLRVTDPNLNISVLPFGWAPPVDNMPFALQCVISGDVSSIVWVKNNDFMDHVSSRVQFPNMGSILLFEPLQSFDSAVYQCADYVDGHLLLSDHYTLRVNYGPRLPVILGQTMLEVGVTLTLRCYADCHPQCNYTWFLGDRVFWHGSHVEVQLKNLTDSSIIHCQASNAVTGLSRNASSILTGNETSVEHVSGKLPLDQQSFNLTCSTQSNFSAIFWFKDGASLVNDRRVSLSHNNSTLSFNPLLPSDSAFYQCSPIQAPMGVGYTLNVIYGPENVSITGPLVLTLGGSYAFECNAPSSYPSCKYTWYFEHRQVVYGQHYELDSVTWADNSTLRCVAYNSVTRKNATDSVWLTVVNGAILFKLSSAALLAAVIPLLLPILTLAG